MQYYGSFQYNPILLKHHKSRNKVTENCEQSLH